MDPPAATVLNSALGSIINVKNYRYFSQFFHFSLIFSLFCHFHDTAD